jgi:hypothetical protein
VATPRKPEITGTGLRNPAPAIRKHRSEKDNLEKLNVPDQIWPLPAGNLICNFVTRRGQSAIALSGVFE